MATVKAAHAVSESLDKLDCPTALDQFLREAFVDSPQYTSARCVRQLKSKNLKLFELVLLAHVVHMEAPTYTCLKHNCYWYITTFFDAIVVCWGPDPSTTPGDLRKETKFDANLDAPGRGNGLKITTSNAQEISIILSKYKGAYCYVQVSIVRHKSHA